jgi:hypothetical protein
MPPRRKKKLNPKTAASGRLKDPPPGSVSHTSFVPLREEQHSMPPRDNESERPTVVVHDQLNEPTPQSETPMIDTHGSHVRGLSNPTGMFSGDPYGSAYGSFTDIPFQNNGQTAINLPQKRKGESNHDATMVKVFKKPPVLEPDLEIKASSLVFHESATVSQDPTSTDASLVDYAFIDPLITDPLHCMDQSLDVDLDEIGDLDEFLSGPISEDVLRFLLEPGDDEINVTNSNDHCNDDRKVAYLPADKDHSDMQSPGIGEKTNIVDQTSHTQDGGHNSVVPKAIPEKLKLPTMREAFGILRQTYPTLTDTALYHMVQVAVAKNSHRYICPKISDPVNDIGDEGAKYIPHTLPPKRGGKRGPYKMGRCESGTSIMEGSSSTVYKNAVMQKKHPI